MSDPLSLAASIAGLISLADVTFKYTYKFVRAAKDAKTDVSALADEINNLGSVLRVLEALASDMEAEGDQFDPTLRNHYLNHCFKTLSRIEMKTKKATERFVRSKVDCIYQHLKWPFSSSETNSLLDELSRHKETINMALAADSMQKLQISLTKMDKLGESISKVEKIVKRIEINTLIDLNAQKQQVLNYFMKADPQDNLATSIKLRHSMTGLWLTESTDFVRWIETPGSKLWLTGIPGAGKTVLAGSVIQEALSRSYANHSIAVAFFFCDYKDPKTWETVNILGAIANQLARQGKEAFEILSLYYDDLHPPDQFITIPDQDEVRARISQMSHLFDQTIIIIDGLDECGDHTDDVVDTLMQMTEDSENTSLAVFSRDHYNIRVHLETDFDIIPIIARTNDIQLYVGAELDRRVRTKRLQLSTLHMREEIHQVLVSRAEGMFRWVVCQLDYLCDCAHDEERREALNKLPPDLPESYRRLLERVNRCSPRVQDMVQKCLHFLTINDAKLTIGELRQAISAPTQIGETLTESNTVTEQEILRRCSSLIRKSTVGNHFEFAHFSVREFLQSRSAVFSSPGLEKYWIDCNSTCALFSTQCLLFLQMANFNAVPIEFEEVFISNISDLTCQIKETYPFYKHAATWWLRNTKDGLDNSAVLTLVQSLFNPSKRACFMLWAVEVLQQVAALDHILSGRNFYEAACRIVIQSSFRPLHMAAALNISEICGSLLLDEPDPNRRFETANYLDLAFISVLGIPGMPHLSAEKSKEYWRVRNAVELFLPSFERRHKTIDCLIAKEAQPSSHRISQSSASVLSITCVLAATYNNLSPITKFLSLNTTPTLSDIKVLGHWINTAEPYDKPAELSAKGLLQFIDQRKAQSTDWGREAVSTVLKWRLKSGFTFMRDMTFQPISDSSSTELGMTQIHTAIRSDNVDIIERWLNDGHHRKERLRLADEHKIMHFAVQHDALRVFKHLVDAGCDPYTTNDQGNLPVHEAVRRSESRYLEVLRTFKDAGVSLFTPDARGNNILHIYWIIREEAHGFFKHMYDLDPQGVIKGFQMINSENQTPLTLLLSTQYHHLVDLRKFLSWMSGLLMSHEGASNPSKPVDIEKAIDYLLTSSQEFRAMTKVDPIPLHFVGYHNSLEQVQVMARVYPEAISCRHEARLPIQRYISDVLHRKKMPINLDIIRSLIPKNLSRMQENNEPTLWEWILKAPHKYIDNRHHDICAILMHHGIMQAHEKQVKRSGLLSLGLALDRPGFLRTVRKVIEHTEYWNEVKNSKQVSSLFQYVITCANLDMIEFMLEKDANLHCHDGVSSPIEVAFQGTVALKICNSEPGIQIYKNILEHADTEKLVSPSAYQNLSLLHMLATDEDTSTILWLAEELICRGLEINQPGSGYNRDSAVNHHIRKHSFQFAELLLQNGASPLIDGVLSFEAIRSAIEVDNVAFLELIVAHTGKLSAEVSWTDLEPFYAVNENATRDLLVDPANALHVASTSKSFACLKYLLEEGLAKEALVQHQDSTPLHVAAFMGSVEAVELLLGHGLDVAARNSLYQAPLHLAAQVGSLAVVKCLLRHGASDCFDAFVETAETVALELGFVGIVYTLQEAKNEEARREHGKRRGPEKTRDHLATEFERAVRAYNYTGITNLMDSGCSIDVHMPKRQGGSALILALELESPAMVKWLFEHGASVLSAKYTNGVEDSVIEIASARAIFSNQLTDIVRRYWLQGGNLVTDEDFPFHDAVWNSNTLGLAALINECRTYIDAKGGKDLSAILNRQSLSVFYGTNNWRSGTHHAFTTPLHIASWLGNKPGVSLMVNHGALVDASDGNGWTPLMYARSVDMACHLIRLGASTSAFCRFGSLTSMTRWFGPELFQKLYELLPRGLPEELLDQRSPQQFPTACDDIPITGAILGKMSELQQDLLAEDHAGRSLMHCIVCEDDLFYFALNNYPDLKDIGPFPWHLEWRSFSSLAFLTSSFCKYRRYVPFESFKTFLNLEPSRGWSPLCRAAASNIVTIVENCLDMGADIDFEGCPLGSAVMIASACGSLEAVISLVRKGASVTYTSEDRFKSCYLLAGTQPVKDWLLVGRYRDVMTLTDGSDTAPTKDESLWSGYGTVKVVLYGKRARGPDESDRDYRRRLARLKRSLHGKIVYSNVHKPTAGTGTELTGRSGL